MTSVVTRRSLAVLTALALALPVPLGASDIKTQSNVGSSVFVVSPPHPAKQLPTFEVVTPIPEIVDLAVQDFVPISCRVHVEKAGNGLKGIKGSYTSHLIVRDNMTGELDAFPVDSGGFKTNKRGIATFALDMPTQLFADGFESGDVSAWSYTRGNFKKRKRVDNASVQCDQTSDWAD